MTAFRSFRRRSISARRSAPVGSWVCAVTPRKWPYRAVGSTAKRFAKRDNRRQPGDGEAHARPADQRAGPPVVSRMDVAARALVVEHRDAKVADQQDRHHEPDAA